MSTPTNPENPSSTASTLHTTLTLTPTTHKYPSPPPTLRITVQSPFTRSITIYTWGTILSPSHALLTSQFDILNLETSTSVTQASIKYQRLPPTRVRGSADDQFFITLMPGKEVSVEGVFGPENYEARRKDDPERKQTEGREAKRSMGVRGVDGLEKGRYILKVGEKAKDVWWCWGTREEVLVEREEGVDISLGEGEGRIGWGEVEEVEFEVL